MASDNNDDSTLVLVLGYLACGFLVSLMMPQIYLNWSRGSVEGFSLGMTVLWHSASTLCTGYLFATDAATPLIVTWGLNAWTFVMCEAQFAQYRGRSETELKACCDEHEESEGDSADNSVETPKPNRRCHVFLMATVALTIPTIMGIALVWWICAKSARWVGVAIGGVLPTVFLGLGFLPQIHEIVAKSSTEGLSLGITALDLCGCGCGLATVMLSNGDLAAAVPFVVLISFQLVMATLILCVYPNPDGLCAGEGASRKEVQSTTEKELDCLEDNFEVRFHDSPSTESSI